MSLFICCFPMFLLFNNTLPKVLRCSRGGLLTSKYQSSKKKASDPEEDRARLQSGNATVEEAISRATRRGRVLLCHSATPITIEQRISYFFSRDFWDFVAYEE